MYTINTATNEIWETANPAVRGLFAGADPLYQAYQAWHLQDPEHHQLTSVDIAPPPSAADLTQLIQQRLDDFAATHGFSSILSACSYISSKIPPFAADAQRCVDLRDATWATAYQIEQQVLAGQRAMPTWPELQELLPPLTWS
jgi:hypothetical protein